MSRYSNQYNEDGTGRVWLQGFGWCNAIPASEIEVGDILVWNYGYTSQVVEVVKETQHFRTFRTRVERDHKHAALYTRKLKKGRLVSVGQEAFDRVRGTTRPVIRIDTRAMIEYWESNLVPFELSEHDKHFMEWEQWVDHWVNWLIGTDFICGNDIHYLYEHSELAVQRLHGFSIKFEVVDYDGR